VPEGLLPTVTLAMAMAARRMAKRRTLVRHLTSVEALGAASVICTDKTGTLTQNRMAIKAIYVDGRPLDPSAVRVSGFAAAHRRFVDIAGSCHDLRPSSERERQRWIGDPMEVALVEMAKATRGDVPALPRIDEVPFEPDRKRLVTVHRQVDEIVLFVKGAPEELLPRAHRVESQGRPQPLTAEERRQFEQAATAMADQGLRVLALAYIECSQRRTRCATPKMISS
jgi:sodium/potassium-transporting ATPase subunit alpha